MRIPTLQEARGLVSRPNNDLVVRYEDGITSDIQKEIYEVARISRGSTVALSRKLKDKTDLETLRNVWAFTRQIKYKLDPVGQQWVKTPNRTIHDGYSDCKSYSILIHTLLTELSIPNGFRFHAYRPGPVTHIFNYAVLNGKKVMVDACLSEFGKEASHLRSEEFMPQISRLSGPGIMGPADLGAVLGNISENSGVPRIFTIDGTEDEVLAELKGYGETAWHELAQAEAIHGIGSPLHNELTEAVSDYVQGIQALAKDDFDAFDRVTENIGKRLPRKVFILDRLRTRVKNGTATAADKETWKKILEKRKAKGIHEIGSAVGSIGRKKRRRNLFKKAGNLARKAGKGVKKVAKKAVNVAKKAYLAPFRLIIRVFLPKAAPFFLYLFITNPQTIASLPPKVARKRKKAERVSKFIINTLGMKASLFMRLVRNGIQRKYKRSPEQVLSASVKGKINGIEGIGEIGYIDAVVQLLQKIFETFGKKGEQVSADDAPDPASDWDSAPVRTRRKVAAHVKNKPFSRRGQEPAEPEEEAAQDMADSAAQDQIDQEPEDTPLDAPTPDAEPDPESF